MVQGLLVCGKVKDSGSISRKTMLVVSFMDSVHPIIFPMTRHVIMAATLGIIWYADSVKSDYGARSVGVWKGEGLGFYQQEDYARRFIHGFGSPNYFSNDSACYNGRYIGYHLVCGFWNSYPVFDQAGLIILLGSNPPICHPPFMREFADARSKGGI